MKLAHSAITLVLLATNPICGWVLFAPQIVKCYISEHKYISIFQVMPITRELLSKKLKKGTSGVYWLMEYFYTHDDYYNLTASKPFATL